MKKYLNFVYDIINILLLFFVLTTLSFYFILLLKKEPQTALPFIILILLIISYLFNLYIKNFILYIVLHILVFSCIQILPLALETRIICSFVCFIFGIYDIRFWKNDDSDYVLPLPGFMGLTFLVTCIHGTGGLSAFLGTYSYYCGILYMTLYLFRIYMMNMLQFQSTVSEKSYVPLKEIVKQNTGIIGIFTSVLFVLSLLFRSRTLENLLTYLFHVIGKAFRLLLIFLLSLIPKSQPTEDAEFLTDNLTPQTMVLESETSPNIITYILNFLFIILQYLIIAGIVCLAIYSLYLFIKRYMNRSETASKREENFDIIEVKERIRRPKDTSKAHYINRKNNNELVRYYYKKRVGQLIKHGYHPLKKHTPLERAEDVKTKMSSSLDNITKCYYIARYSNESISKEQANAAKE